MPPKRKAAFAPPPNPTPQPARPSKLAREHGITAAQEAEIREAFSIFAIHHPDYKDAKEGVLRAEDVRRCLIALSLPPAKQDVKEILETLDPLTTGLVPFIPFLSYAAICIHDRESVSGSPSASPEPISRKGKGKQKAGTAPSTTSQREINEAYALFTHNTSGPITLAHLRRVARDLREEVDDEVLRDMIREANGNVAAEGLGGVGLEEFEGVMKRAGVFG
ncbi:EF-hand [Mytilinidion resinicola]|uniref:Calmodulin n=1 Tax=Mytilinidion resinicola TaxID=574789 RepID=A0A6A6YMF1_9PEZI|nr:EF-hand [Mytilinidion resinicola]KAF2809155.1 EF-hand [Mytilinidion resinicola]